MFNLSERGGAEVPQQTIGFGTLPPAIAGSASDAPALARPAAVVRGWRHVADGGNRESHRLQRAQRTLAARARPADLDLQVLHAMLARLLAGILGGDLGGIGRRFTAALEPLAAGGRPRDGVALCVGDGDHRVVERRGDMGDAGRDVLALLPAGACTRGGSRHYSGSCFTLRRPHRAAPDSSSGWAAKAEAGLLCDLLLARDCHCLPLARPRIGVGPLAAHRQPTPVPQATIAAE